MSRLQQRKQRRDIIYLRQGEAPAADYCWNLSVVMDYCVSRYAITESKIKIMLFAYSMESFLLSAFAEKMNRDAQKLWEKQMKDMVKDGWIKEELYSMGPDAEFYNKHEHSSQANGVSKRRWALSTKGRQFVSKFYQYLEGSRAMNPDVL